MKYTDITEQVPWLLTSGENRSSLVKQAYSNYWAGREANNILSDIDDERGMYEDALQPRRKNQEITISENGKPLTRGELIRRSAVLEKRRNDLNKKFEPLVSDANKTGLYWGGGSALATTALIYGALGKIGWLKNYRKLRLLLGLAAGMPLGYKVGEFASAKSLRHKAGLPLFNKD